MSTADASGGSAVCNRVSDLFLFLMFAKRLISSIVLWALLLGVLFFLPPPASALFCCFVVIIALWEFYEMLEKGGLRCSKPWGIAGGTLLSAGSWWFSAYQRDFTGTFEVLVLVFLVFALFLRQLADRDNPGGLHAIGNTLLGVLYIPLLFGFIPKIKYLYDGVHGPGWLLVLYLVVVTKFCDTGAYGGGRIFGRHKMIPRISPNKTWEGLLGGMVAAVIASVTAYQYLHDRIAGVGSGFGYRDALILGVLLGALGSMGDLAESMLKREVNAKDSGGVLPGIGGALDLIDSLLFTAPVLYAYLVLVVRV